MFVIEAFSFGVLKQMEKQLQEEGLVLDYSWKRSRLLVCAIKLVWGQELAKAFQCTQ